MTEQQLGPLPESSEIGQQLAEIAPATPLPDREVRDDQPRVYFDCAKCPAFCCSVYERVQVTKRDLNRLARYFGITPEQAERRYTRNRDGERVLRRVEDTIFEETCTFLDQQKRCCTIYHARPAVCRTYPARSRCAYYDLLQFERRQQQDPNCVPVVQLIFRENETADAVP
jgi:uncharacterized protein